MIKRAYNINNYRWEAETKRRKYINVKSAFWCYSKENICRDYNALDASVRCIVIATHLKSKINPNSNVMSADLRQRIRIIDCSVWYVGKINKKECWKMPVIRTGCMFYAVYKQIKLSYRHTKISSFTLRSKLIVKIFQKHSVVSDVITINTLVQSVSSKAACR
jgi:hypothetical protein